MRQSATARAGRFHQGRSPEGRPQALDAWRVTTDDADVAARVADFLGGAPQSNGGGGDLAHEDLTHRDSVRVIMDGPDAVAAHMVLGEFNFMTSSWQLAAQFSDLTDALERVGGPAVCDLTMELVVFTTKGGRGVCYRKPVVTVLGSPDTVAPEPPLTAEPPPAPAPSALRRKARQPPEPATPTVPEPSSCSVALDTSLLERAAQVLGTSNHQETVIAALSEVVAGRRQTRELARLREHVGRIAAIAEQALQDRDSPLA
ncbi:hypothetical protein [Streptomyces lasiicapitis]|uniref:hypothetical protein n=1 Tax=Streptomyces lasiicapitis TaxID=1923961 RepID=UPI0036545004